MFARAVSFVLALVAVAAFAVPAGAHPPDHHKQQMMPASALGPFDWQQRAARVVSAECQDGQAGPYPCKDVDLAGFVPLPALGGPTGNDIWGWTDPETGQEWAIMGTALSTGFVDVTDPSNPTLVAILPTRGLPDNVLWRDVKVSGNYAYIVSEVTNSGMQVFDLTRLRDEQGILSADATYDGFSTAHNISINTETQTAYAVGTDFAATLPPPDECNNGDESGGLHMIDISDPLAPTFAGCALVPDADGDRRTESNNYAHDVECIVYDGPDTDYTGKEICFGSNENAVVIYNITDGTIISQTTYDTVAYTHQGSLTGDRRYFLFGDELDEGPLGFTPTVESTTTYILDVQDLDNPPEPKAFTHETGAIDHNMYVHGNLAFQSNYTEGLRILEFDNDSLAAGQLREVAYFDVVPGSDANEFAGTWSNYRFPGSGTVVVSAIENEANGLFVLTPRVSPDDGSQDEEPAPQPQPAPEPEPQPEQQPAPPAQAAAAPACKPTAGFADVGVEPRANGRKLRFEFERNTSSPVLIDVFRASKGRKVVRSVRVARFEPRKDALTWNGLDESGDRLANGYYFVRFRMRQADGRADIRRITLRRKGGRFFVAKPFYARTGCALLSSAKLRAPVFGGRGNRSLKVAFTLTKPSRLIVSVFRGKDRVHRVAARRRAAEVMQRLTIPARKLKRRGTYKVRIVAVSGGKRERTTLYARRL